MSVNFSFILVMSMLSVRTPLEAMNVIVGVVTVAMEGYVMVMECMHVLILIMIATIVFITVYFIRVLYTYRH